MDLALPADQGAAEALGDPRFFRRAGPFSLARLMQEAGAEPQEAGAGTMLSGVAPLQAAGPDDVSFMHNKRYMAALRETRAGAVVVGANLAGEVPSGSARIVARDPQTAWARIATLFHPPPEATPGVHATAIIDASAEIGPGCEIGPYVVIGAGAGVGAGCRIGAGAVIGAGVVLGEGCRIGPLASVSHAILGRRVYLYPGVRIGQEGYGFAVTAQGFLTVPQLGRVVLHDDVEVGANSTIDRGAAHDTVVGRGTRIDNLVQIGHNVRLGAWCVVAGQAGIAGSAIVEDHVQIAAQAGLSGHLTIGARARIGPQCGVMSDVPAGTDVLGSPAMPVREFFRNVAVLRKLARKGTVGRQAEGDGQHST